LLKKDFHTAIVGSNYLSLILAIDLIKNGKDVLVLDDDRMDLGELFGTDLGLLELMFLKSWGQERHIDALINIEDLISERPYTILGDNSWLSLGHRPSENVYEFSRRFALPLSSLDDDFDQNWIQFVSKVSQAYFRYGGFQQITPDKLMVYAPPSIKELYEQFKIFIATPRDWSSESLLSTLMSYYSKRIDVLSDEGDIFFFFVALFSPRYLLKQDVLVEQLLTAYKELDGYFKQTRMREWLFHKQKPWSIELASYEGIIHPKQLTFIGAFPTGMPLGLNPLVDHYVILEATSPVEAQYTSLKSYGLMIVTSEKSIGTESPFWFIEYQDNKIVVRLLYPASKGMKLEFLKAESLRRLSKKLPLIDPRLQDEVFDWSLNLTSEVFVHVKSVKSSTVNTHSMLKLGLFDSSSPGITQKLKNVDYFGPFRAPKMGLFSSMVDLTIETQFK